MLTAETRDIIFKEILKNPIYEVVLKKYLSDEYELNEFRQHLWVIISELPEEKILHIWNQGYFLFWYCNVIKNQIKSSTSSWHKSYRLANQNVSNSIKEVIDDIEIDQEDTRKEKLQKLILIQDAISYHLRKNPRLQTEFKLFNLKYVEGYTYREISKKTKIPLASTFQAVLDAEILIRSYVNMRHNKLR